MKKLLLIWFIVAASTSQAQLKFHWRQYSGPVTADIKQLDSAQSLVTGLDQVGIYGFELTATSDSTGLSGKDSCLVTVISGTLGIAHDSVYHVTRPKITKLSIQTASHGDKIYMIIRSPRVQQLQCVLYDDVGRKLAQAELFLKEGTNYLTLPKPRIAGVYILRFATYFDSVTKEIFI